MKVRVTNCGDCPFVDWELGSHCMHPLFEEGRAFRRPNGKLLDKHPERPPEWCPLRESATVVEAAFPALVEVTP
jgi:hypothetical protein